MTLRRMKPSAEFLVAKRDRSAALSSLEERMREFEERAQAFIKSVPPNSVLVVEDHGITSRTIERILRDDFIEVDVVSTVEGAREALSGKRYGLVILDQFLPDGDGWVLVGEIPRTVAVALISGIIGKEDLDAIREAAHAEAVLHIADFDHFISTVRRLMKMTPGRDSLGA